MNQSTPSERESRSRREPVAGPAAWYGRDLAPSTEWMHRLAPSEIEEIEAALASVNRRGLALADVRRPHFPLPTVGPLLGRMQHQLVEGRGFVVIRGLPVERWSTEQAAMAYWGLGTYFGHAVSQNAKGHLLGHVRDLGGDPNDPVRRVYTTRRRQRFHTDSCDIVGLLCLQTAKSGGKSSLASSVTLYNEMLEGRADLVEVLARPLYFDRKGEVPPGKKAYYPMPVFHSYAGYLTTIYARDFIESAQRLAEVPRLSAKQVEAMDLLEHLAGSEDIRLDMELVPGDMQWLHNHQILHARSDYEDHSDPKHKRHLLRLWLSPPNGRLLPPVFAERYGSVEVGRRGGIVVSGARMQTPLVPE